RQQQSRNVHDFASTRWLHHIMSDPTVRYAHAILSRGAIFRDFGYARAMIGGVRVMLHRLLLQGLIAFGIMATTTAAWPRPPSRGAGGGRGGAPGGGAPPPRPPPPHRAPAHRARGAP